MSLLPKEHGAYGQLTFPIVTAVAVSGFTVPTAAVAFAAVAGFLAHEPAKILMGQRGPRAARELRQSAIRWLAVCAAVLIAAAVVALLTTAAPIRWALLVPALPAGAFILMTVRGREKSTAGELTGAMAFSGVAVPMTLAAGGTVTTALAIVVPFSLLFVAGTLAVRVVILRVRGGGDPEAVAAARKLVYALAGTAVVILGWASAAGLLPASILLAAAPGLATAVMVATHPPAPARLRRLGWTLVATSTVAAMVTIVAARL